MFGQIQIQKKTVNEAVPNSRCEETERSLVRNNIALHKGMNHWKKRGECICLRIRRRVAFSGPLNISFHAKTFLRVHRTLPEGGDVFRNFASKSESIWCFRTTKPSRLSPCIEFVSLASFALIAFPTMVLFRDRSAQRRQGRLDERRTANKMSNPNLWRRKKERARESDSKWKEH